MDPNASLRSEPWLTEGAIRFLESFVCAGQRVLELGAGASTVWLCAAGCDILSFENDAGWKMAVRKATTRLRGNLTFGGEESLAAYREFATRSFDLVLVDGNLDRVASLYDCIRLVKPGGVLMADNWDWIERDPDICLAIRETLALWNETISRQRQPDKHGFCYSADGSLPCLWATAWWERPKE